MTIRSFSCCQPCLEVIRLVELAKGAPADYDLQARYQHFNELLFDSQLPQIPIRWGALKGVGAVVNYSMVRLPSAPPGKIPAYLQNKYFRLMADTLKMTVSTVYKRSHAHLDSLMLHEMIHVYMAAVAHDYTESHGAKFMAMRADLIRRSGVDIPVRDAVDDLELAVPVKPVGVLVMRRNTGKFVYQIYPANLLVTKLEEAKAYARRLENGVTVEDVWIKIAEDELWTRKSATMAAKRKIDGSRLYWLDDQAAIAALDQGRTLFYVGTGKNRLI